MTTPKKNERWPEQRLGGNDYRDEQCDLLQGNERLGFKESKINKRKGCAGPLGMCG
jgi:hypothetical protein